MRNTGLRPVAGTGPYRIAHADRRDIRFVRNPYFREWSRAAQPAGNPDEIVWRFGLDRASQIRAVRAGRADWSFEGVPNPMAAEIANRHAGQLHINDLPQTDFLQLNPRGIPFRDVRVRRAVNFALDRRKVVEAYGGPDQATPTCQVLPHGLRARRNYCPYTRDARPDGLWRGPDLPRARRLVAASGTAGARVTIWNFTDLFTPAAIVGEVADVLRKLGFRPRVRTGTHDDLERLSTRERRAIDLIPSDWMADFPSPSSFFDTFLACRSATAGGFYCDPAMDRMMRRAHARDHRRRSRRRHLGCRRPARRRPRRVGPARQPARRRVRFPTTARLPVQPATETGADRPPLPQPVLARRAALARRHPGLPVTGVSTNAGLWQLRPLGRVETATCGAAREAPRPGRVIDRRSAPSEPEREVVDASRHPRASVRA